MAPCLVIVEFRDDELQCILELDGFAYQLVLRRCDLAILLLLSTYSYLSCISENHKCSVLFVTGTGKNYRVIELGPIQAALGDHKTVALPGLHAISGSDNTGSCAGKGKLSFWKAFKCANEASVTALESLGASAMPTDETFASIEQFICQVYLTQTSISRVAKLRWWLFKKKQAKSERLPPTSGALRQAILRAQHQAIVWHHDITACPVIPSPGDYEWQLENNEWAPVKTTELPAPESVLHLIKCSCNQQCQTDRCSCRKANLKCTDMCKCSDEDDACDNIEKLATACDEIDDDDDSSDDEKS